MENITYTKIHVGLEKPVKILHVTDVHITKANEKDTPEHHRLMKRREEVFKKEGNFPPKTPEEYFLDAIAFAKKKVRFSFAREMPLTCFCMIPT